MSILCVFVFMYNISMNIVVNYCCFPFFCQSYLIFYLSNWCIICVVFKILYLYIFHRFCLCTWLIINSMSVVSSRKSAANMESNTEEIFKVKKRANQMTNEVLKVSGVCLIHCLLHHYTKKKPQSMCASRFN